MVKVLFKRLNQKAKLPSYKTAGSSGMDLMACIDEPITIKPNESNWYQQVLQLQFLKIQRFKLDQDQALLQNQVLAC